MITNVEDRGYGNMASSFSREINRDYYGRILNLKEDDYMLMFGFALILIGVFIIGKYSDK